jgi:DNA-binding PadR family transcriptional regulator
MSIVDIFLLTILTSKEILSLSNIVQQIQLMDIEKVPSRIAIYKRLHVLNRSKLLYIFWEKDKKFYLISLAGLFVITEFKNQINGIKSV